MTVATLDFTVDDFALAISEITEAETDRIEYKSRDQMEQDTAQVSNRVRARVMNLARLHGCPNLTDADETNGDPAAVRAIMRALDEYAADPDGYIDRFAPEDRDPPAETETNAPQPAAVAAAPTESLIAPAMQAPTPPAAPAPRVRYVDRTMKGLFPGVSDDYATEMVPTAKWTGDKPHLGTPDENYCFSGFTVKVMASALRRRKNVMAVGDPGCGKTEFFKQFAARIGLPYHGITFDGQLSRAEIIGSFRQIATPTGSATPFVDGLIPTLIQRPGILCLNEIDQCDPDIQYMLHDMYEGGGLTIQEDGGRFVPRHPDCHIVATANTKGRGSDSGLTHARHEMSEATRDRYPIWLNFTYLSEDRETATIVAKSGMDAATARSLTSIGNSIRTSYRNGSMSQPCSLRQLLDVAELFEDFMDGGAQRALAIACDLVLAGRANVEDTLQIREFVKQNTSIDLTVLEL